MLVRNAASGTVQLTYGDDGLDPVSMKGKVGTPINFVRALTQVKVATPMWRPQGWQWLTAVFYKPCCLKVECPSTEGLCYQMHAGA